jgi:hypothetical protein
MFFLPFACCSHLELGLYHGHFSLSCKVKPFSYSTFILKACSYILSCYLLIYFSMCLSLHSLWFLISCSHSVDFFIFIY